jgi:hypothetical protein
MQFVNEIDPGVSKTQPPGYVLVPLRGTCAASTKLGAPVEDPRSQVVPT